MFTRFFKHFSFTPEKFYRFAIKFIIPLIYNITFIGFEKIPKRGPVLLIANHVSYMDGVIIQTACQRPVRFMIDKFIYNLPIIHYFMKHNRAIPIYPKKEDVTNALEEISKGLEGSDVICIFPEGHLTYTGTLGRFKPGIEWIIERDPVPVYPIALNGLWGSALSRKYLHSRYRWIPRSFRRKVTAVCGDPIHPGHLGVNSLQEAILALKR